MQCNNKFYTYLCWTFQILKIPFSGFFADRLHLQETNKRVNKDLLQVVISYFKTAFKFVHKNLVGGAKF